ncbi:TetR family transcriptional regulator [Nostoc cycadae WK-1]|uniref:TetR family transcriptional regulator n=2 Tax=Nostoc cycadae TaxID=246795 RepID=A0A2H6LL34_9NOSO|nr:TetR family transcriptional regulator [Nostoc cycadae WK-1]
MEGVESTNFFQTHRLPPTQVESKPRVNSKAFDADKVEQYLKTMLISNEFPPPSMEEVARRLSCDRRAIFRHFRDLCSAISAKYIQYRKACYLENVEICCKEVRDITLKLHNLGQYPTEARVSEFMSKPGYLRNKIVRAALGQIRHELGI